MELNGFLLPQQSKSSLVWQEHEWLYSRILDFKISNERVLGLAVLLWADFRGSSFRILALIDSPLLSHEGLGVMPHYIEKTRNCCYILTLLGTDNLRRTKQHSHPTFIVFQLLLCCKIWWALIWFSVIISHLPRNLQVWCIWEW